MQKRTANIVFWIVFSLSTIWSGILFVSGIVWMRGWFQTDVVIPNPWHNWQEFTMPVVLLSYLPFALLGWKQPRTASKLLFGGAVVTIIQLLGSSHYNGDSMAAWFFAAVGLVGFPMLLTGLLFQWRLRELSLKIATRT